MEFGSTIQPEQQPYSQQSSAPSFLVSLMCGAVAGLSVDIALFPLDTIKTRLQSGQGFIKAGGFRGIYSGLGSVAIGSAPGAALFFCTYESVKRITGGSLPNRLAPLSHVVAAASGELIACLVRVPTEVVKQRAQTSDVNSSLRIFRNTLTAEGVRGLYRGFFSTVVREVPFSFMQFPLWEHFKKMWSTRQGAPVVSWQSSLCGALAGGIAAALTTPLDVAKTRIMIATLNSELSSGSIRLALVTIWRTEGYRGLFAGIIPRTVWIAVGGSIFLGAYDKAKSLLTR